jgi:acetyltransferase-like isoleucine patch superfamily enzyme
MISQGAHFFVTPQRFRMRYDELVSRVFMFLLRVSGKVSLGRCIKMRKLPSIVVIDGASLEIGNCVILNSDNYGYHANMHSGCKILIDRKGARVVIGDNTRINGACIHSQKEILIGKNCLIAANTQIFDCNGHDLSFPHVNNRVQTMGVAETVVIEDNVWLGLNVVVLPGVTIGYGSVIAANSVVHKSVPPMCLAGGNPLTIIKRF